MLEPNCISIPENDSFYKLSLVKDLSSVKCINITGRRNYNEEVVQDIIKFKKVETLIINALNNDDLREIANLQSLIDLETCYNNDFEELHNNNCLISKNNKNAIINVRKSTYIEKVITSLNSEIENITIFINDNCNEKLFDNLPTNNKNLRIVIRFFDYHKEALHKYSNLKLSNLPVTLKKLDIIFRRISKRVENKNVILADDLIMCDLIKNKFAKEIKIPFDCEFNVSLK